MCSTIALFRYEGRGDAGRSLGVVPSSAQGIYETFLRANSGSWRSGIDERDEMTRTTSLLLALAASIFPAPLAGRPATAASADALQRYGRHLARECTGCHRPDAPGSAIPALAGRPADEIVELLQAYRSGRKTNPVMVSVAKSLDDEQSAALAAYFSSLPEPAPAPLTKGP